jgi:hypothetical protein
MYIVIGKNNGVEVARFESDDRPTARRTWYAFNRRYGESLFIAPGAVPERLVGFAL